MEEILHTNARAVLEVLRASQRHPTAFEVYESVRITRPRIGLATVYRILHQLTEQGLIKELAYGSGCSRYDACTRRHDHAFCTECGALLDIPQDVQLSTKALQVAAHLREALCQLTVASNSVPPGVFHCRKPTQQ